MGGMLLVGMVGGGRFEQSRSLVVTGRQWGGTVIIVEE